MFIIPISVFAQTFKFGHLSSQDIFTEMPERAKAVNELQTLEKKYRDEIQRTNDEFQKKYQEFLEARDSLPQNISEKRQKELQDMMQRSEQFQQEAQQMLVQKQEELMTPIYQKIDNAIKAVGEAQGMTFIFDTSRTAIPYINTTQSTDVTALIKAELGIK
jgi:outer membrane protein